jgi:hypothetical protein
MKKIVSIIICLAIVLSCVVCFASDDVKVVVGGNEVVFDQPPVIQEGRTLVPLRAIFEALGASVGWDGETSSVIASKDDTVIIMQIGHGNLYKNNETIKLDVPPVIINSRTLVPVRAIAESFDLTVEWDDATRTVTVK